MMKIPLSKNGDICQILSRINDSAPLLFYVSISLLLQKNHSAAFAFFLFFQVSCLTSGLLFLSSMLHTDHTYHTDDLLSPGTADLWTWLLSLLQDGEGSADSQASDMV